jgi:hypothetical protein
MSEPATTAQRRIDAFWAKFLTLVKKRGVREDAERWYVLRAEGFVKAMQPRRLAELMLADLDGFLAAQGRNTGVRPWQLMQIVDAIQMLGQTAEAAWAARVDWPRWRDSAKGLAASGLGYDVAPTPERITPCLKILWSVPASTSASKKKQRLCSLRWASPCPMRSAFC